MPNGLEYEITVLRGQFEQMQREMNDLRRQLDLANEFFRRVKDLVVVFDTKLL